MRAESSTGTTAGDRVRAFPFPFAQDSYRYSTNLGPAGQPVQTPAGRWGDSVLHIDAGYEAELSERQAILSADPSRMQVLPHMRPAAWDAMLTLMQELAAAYPESMTLRRDSAGTFWWTNRRRGIDQRFVYGDPRTLPQEPLAFIGDQVQEDIVLLDQREDQLFVDAGLVCFASNWSFGFDLGMSFLEIHGPVPRVHDTGVIARAQQLVMRLQPDAPYRRTNWSLAIGGHLDLSTENYPEWGPGRDRIHDVDDAAFGAELHLRVEVQHLLRLPESGCVMFLIRTYQLPFEVIAEVEPWRERLAAVLAELPEDMADYKGFSAYRDRAVDWLRARAASAP
ncbi:heme-dependent oxidative N-demethylase family protein [Nesterenkonia sp. CF4.4]|uniref:heme-dependent oxidative N-demethylase family protein n=1 Tax=Nesterenkonia sp. CF4.4 TaxID=3373079 RepID=UPI003EE45679